MASKRQASRNKSENMAEQFMVEKLDALSALEEFEATVLPAIRKDIKSGMGAAEIRKKYAAIVQASMVTTALTDPMAAARLTAGKDILDRHEGKAKENKEVTHKFQNLSDEQLKAILNSEESDLENE